MASTETDGYKSRFRREPAAATTREPRTVATTAGRRRMFEDGASETSNTTVSSTVTARSTASSSVASSRVGSRFSSQNTAALSPSKQDDETIINERISKIPVKDEEDDKGDDEEQEEDTSTKPMKKDRGGASISSTNKRRAKKNIREKRKSTGVVIMPGQPNVARDEEERIVMENTAKNMHDSTVSSVDGGSSGDDREELLKQIEKYEQVVEEWKDALSQAKREIESLRNDNTRLKDENSALLRVVGSLSHGGRK